MAEVLDSLLERSAPMHPVRAANWTVLGFGRVSVGGRAASRAHALRLLARAESLAGVDKADDELVVDDRAPHSLGALVLAEPLTFEANSSRLTEAAGHTLAGLVEGLWQFEEVLFSAEGLGDHLQFEDDAVELSRQRVVALTSYVEFRGAGTCEVRVALRTRGLVDARGAAHLRPADRRFEIRIRRAH